MTDTWSVKRVLPPATAQELESVARSRLPPLAKAEKANDIMNKLPDSILDKIPFPPPMLRLPQRIQNQFRVLGRNHALTFQQRAQEAERILATLTPQERASLPKGLLP
ncbi:unnamed protein product [Toxocara canis]|uniref:Chromosome partitioning protein ParB n=1 Tax=Toxocara canis TaxID=6265 RepID=A0A183UPH6_TOXCA|nr:unnamed protein product [Toxocara canis]